MAICDGMRRCDAGALAGDGAAGVLSYLSAFMMRRSVAVLHLLCRLFCDVSSRPEHET